jgi:pimeloyl-ACP methyl ester carboxylesterase
MSAIVAVLLACSIQQASVETRFEQAFPKHGYGKMARSPEQTRAVVLIGGLIVHPLHGSQAARAEFHSWQQSASPVVKALAGHADVFALAYCQNIDLETISRARGFELAIDKLRFLGYREIILVGHSAGGILARLFVEDYPQSAVTRVVQVCAPNLGSSWAKAEVGSRKVQGPFFQSLTKDWRRTVSQKRGDKLIPAHVQFLCVMGTMGNFGDGLVSCQSQWPEDLQRQGIPVVRLPTTHLVVMHSKKTAAYLADLVQREQPRWSPFQVEAARASLLPKKALAAPSSSN